MQHRPENERATQQGKPCVGTAGEGPVTIRVNREETILQPGRPPALPAPLENCRNSRAWAFIAMAALQNSVCRFRKALNVQKAPRPATVTGFSKGQWRSQAQPQWLSEVMASPLLRLLVHELVPDSGPMRLILPPLHSVHLTRGFTPSPTRKALGGTVETEHPDKSTHLLSNISVRKYRPTSPKERSRLLRCRPVQRT